MGGLLSDKVMCMIVCKWDSIIILGGYLFEILCMEKREDMCGYVGSNVCRLTKGWMVEDICFNLLGTIFPLGSIILEVSNGTINHGMFSNLKKWRCDIG